MQIQRTFAAPTVTHTQRERESETHWPVSETAAGRRKSVAWAAGCVCAGTAEEEEVLVLVMAWLFCVCGHCMARECVCSWLRGIVCVPGGREAPAGHTATPSASHAELACSRPSHSKHGLQFTSKFNTFL